MKRDGPQAEVALERAERLLDKAQLHLTTPDYLRIVRRQIGAQEVSVLAFVDQPQCVLGGLIRRCPVGRDLNFDPAGFGAVLRGAESFSTNRRA